MANRPQRALHEDEMETSELHRKAWTMPWKKGRCKVSTHYIAGCYLAASLVNIGRTTQR